jgi:hypothetical protein
MNELLLLLTALSAVSLPSINVCLETLKIVTIYNMEKLND